MSKAYFMLQGDKMVASGLAISSVILSVFGLIFIWMPFLGFILGLLGVIFAVLSLAMIRINRTLDGKSLAITGLVIGAIAALLGGIMTFGPAGWWNYTSMPMMGWR